jgi:hypothetical protein
MEISLVSRMLFLFLISSFFSIRFFFWGEGRLGEEKDKKGDCPHAG